MAERLSFLRRPVTEDQLYFKHPGVYVRDLGHGTSGQVCEIEYQGRLCALKYGDDWSIGEEAKVIEAIGSHPGIVRVLESGVDKNVNRPIWWMVMEKFDETVAYSLRKGNIKSVHIKSMYRQVLEALVHLQEKGFIHDDCHADNVGVKWETPDQPRFILCDFGLAMSYRNKDGVLSSIPPTFRDFGRFCQAVNRYLPFPESVPEALDQEVRNWLTRATDRYKPHVLFYVLELSTEEDIQEAIGVALERPQVDSLRLILAFKALQTNRTLASVCREILESNALVSISKFRRVDVGAVVTMCEWAGYADNPEIREVVSSGNSLVIRRYLKGPMPELLQRILSI